MFFLQKMFSSFLSQKKKNYKKYKKYIYRTRFDKGPVALYANLVPAVQDKNCICNWISLLEQQLCSSVH